MRMWYNNNQRMLYKRKSLQISHRSIRRIRGKATRVEAVPADRPTANDKRWISSYRTKLYDNLRKTKTRAS